MGSTAAVSAVTTRTNQAVVGPPSTIVGGTSGRTQETARTPLWFRDRQFLFTYSPYTKE
jgi:hypothetical protein